MGKKTTTKSSRNKDTGRTDKYSDENPLKDYEDYRRDVSKEKTARKARREDANFSNSDTNNLTILTSRLKAMEKIKPAHRVQPDWDFKHEALLQRVHGLKKLSKTVK